MIFISHLEGFTMKFKTNVLLTAITLSISALCASNIAIAQTDIKTDTVTQGFSKHRLARIAPAVKNLNDNGTTPGVVTLVARNGKVVHFEAHGHLDAAKTKPMKKDSIFRLASMTKPIVSTAAMMLVEQGKLKLNDPVAMWLPELKDLKVETAAGDVPLARPIWVQDILRHTAGFTYAGSTKSPRVKKLYDDLNIESREVDITADEMLKNLGTIPLVNQPGTVWEYSIAVDVLGLLLERVEKKPLDAIIKTMLLDPLGMKDTSWWVEPSQQAKQQSTGQELFQRWRGHAEYRS
jgi:CubicO group peptidase (beta-lactamase class C family)